MSDVIRFLWSVLLFIVPRVVTEDVAVQLRADGDYDLVCPMEDVEPGEVFDGVVTLTSLCWLAWAIPLQAHGPAEMQVRPWPRGGKGGAK